jgi:hypothetical protein
MSDIPGIAFNEDDGHYIAKRAGQQIGADEVESWVDQYAGTQIREMMFCVNSMRTGYDSKVWDSFWTGYDPDGPDDQPLFASAARQNLEAARSARKVIHTAMQLSLSGLDIWEHWISRCRKDGISPWISMRMNDIHSVEDEANFLHSRFWKENPQFRLAPWRFYYGYDRALDYGRPEVREHHMTLIREIAERYDFDGLELDWMRFGYHFRPGYESEGLDILTHFTADVRRLLDGWEQKRGHRIKLGARVPTNPTACLGLGMDAVTWARKGLVQLLVATPFFETIDTDIPIELWKQLLDGTDVVLCAGLEGRVSPFPESSSPCLRNSLETVRGAAASMLDRGADRIYLFNYYDSDTCMDDIQNYPTMLREIGSLDTLVGNYRRHIKTYTDTWALGQPKDERLPLTCSAGRWQAFRIHTGPEPASGQVEAILGIIDGCPVEEQDIELRANGELCALTGAADLPRPTPDFPTYAFAVPLPAMTRGYNVIEFVTTKDITVGWAEIGVRP